MSEFLTQFMERRGELLELTIEHMEMTSLAVLASLIVGGLIGIAITKNDKAAAIVIGIANLMQSIPSIGLLAFMVPFVGIGQKPAIIMVVIYALLPIIKNTYTGITGIDPKLLEAASGIGLSKTQQLLRIQLPLALPFIMAGIRISAVTAVGTVTIAAFAGAGGLGWMINMGLNANDANLVLLGAIPACLLALAVDFVLGKVEKAITPEGLKPADKIVYMPRRKRLARQAVALALCAVLLIVPSVSSLVRSLSKDENRLLVGAQNFTEGMILGDIYVELIEAKTDIPVERVYNLNGLMITMPALENGSIDMVTDYTGMLAPQVLHLPWMHTNPERGRRECPDRYEGAVRLSGIGAAGIQQHLCAGCDRGDSPDLWPHHPVPAGAAGAVAAAGRHNFLPDPGGSASQAQGRAWRSVQGGAGSGWQCAVPGNPFGRSGSDRCL